MDKRRFFDYGGQMMSSQELRARFLSFFENRGHKIVPSSSLRPDDPSVLLTSAGMQQFKKYYTGEADPFKDFGVKNTASAQKCFRTSDIDEVGDESHLTFFEMLGNFSFGGYFKEDAIRHAHDFLKEIGMEIEYVTVFAGDARVPHDTASAQIWRDVGISRIEERGGEDNFWGPTGIEGPCGPTTEIYINGVEIWNIVFNEYYCMPDGTLTPLKQNGVDTGMGLERLAMVTQNKKNIFETDLFAPYLELLPAHVPVRQKRIIVDHLRGAAFLLADGVRPSNKEAGYVLRRLLRRVMVYERMYELPLHVLEAIVHDVVHSYGEYYQELLRANHSIREEITKEREKFGTTVVRGIKELQSLKDNIDGAASFKLYETFGLPFEIIKELGGEKTKDLSRGAFDEEFRKHQEISRAGKEKKFGGHGLLFDTGELKAADEKELAIVTRLHTATHLLNAALRRVLGPEIQQQGSDITVERTRFDFAFPRKLTHDEIQKIETMVNEIIKKDLRVEYTEMPYEEVVKTDALRFWREKYPARVNVYKVFDQETGEVFSKELCGGPHVTHTGEIGTFRIIKEESSSAGIRRIRAVVK